VREQVQRAQSTAAGAVALSLAKSSVCVCRINSLKQNEISAPCAFLRKGQSSAPCALLKKSSKANGILNLKRVFEVKAGCHSSKITGVISKGRLYMKKVKYSSQDLRNAIYGICRCNCLS